MANGHNWALHYIPEACRVIIAQRIDVKRLDMGEVLFVHGLLMVEGCHSDRSSGASMTRGSMFLEIVTKAQGSGTGSSIGLDELQNTAPCSMVEHRLSGRGHGTVNDPHNRKGGAWGLNVSQT